MDRKRFTLEIPWPNMSRIRLASRLTGWLPTRGNVIFTLVIAALLVLAQSAGALPLGRPQAAPASTSTGTIAYQGRLADASGAPLTGTYNMIFRLYDVATGGTPLWSEQWTGSNGVRVSDGLFNVMLGSLTAIPSSLVTSHSSLFLGITVGTDDEMAPRVQLGSVPFAVQALTVPDGSVTTAKIVDGAVTSPKLSLNDGLHMSGDLQVNGEIDSSTNVLLRYATVTTDGGGRASIGAYWVVLKPAHFWMGCFSGEQYWNADYDFDYNPTVGQLSGLYPNCKVVVYYVNSPSGQGNPVSSPPNW